MAFTAKRLAQFVASTAETTRYTVVGAGIKAIVKNIVIANTSAAAVTLGLSIVPVGGTAGNANRIIPTISIPPNAVVPFDMTQVMNEGDFISATASANTALTITISGLEGV